MGSGAIQGQLWSIGASDWAELLEGFHAPLYKAMLSAAGVTTGKTLLDGGCGSGGALVLAHEMGASVTGADAAPGMLAIASKRLPTARFEQADLESMPFKDGEFDATIAVNSVIFTADMSQAVKELARVTSPKGRLVIGTWSRPDNCQMKEVFEAVGATLPQKPPGAGVFGLSAPNAIDDLMAKVGLRVTGRGESPCQFEFENAEMCWRALASGGPLQGAIKTVGLEKVRAAVDPVIQRHTDASGRVTFLNTFMWVSGEHA